MWQRGEELNVHLRKSGAEVAPLQSRALGLKRWLVAPEAITLQR